MGISVFINVLVHYVMDIALMNILVTVMIIHVDHILFLSESFSRIEKPMNQNSHDERTQLEINIHKNISFNSTPNLISSSIWFFGGNSYQKETFRFLTLYFPNYITLKTKKIKFKKNKEIINSTHLTYPNPKMNFQFACLIIHLNSPR